MKKQPTPPTISKAAQNEIDARAATIENLTAVAFQRPDSFNRSDPVWAARAEVSRRLNSNAALVSELQACHDLFGRCIKEQHSFVSMMLGLVSVQQANIRSVIASAKGVTP